MLWANFAYAHPFVIIAQENAKSLYAFVDKWTRRHLGSLGMARKNAVPAMKARVELCKVEMGHRRQRSRAAQEAQPQEQPLPRRRSRRIFTAARMTAPATRRTRRISSHILRYPQQQAHEAHKNAKFIISSGGAPRKAGMTREDLLAVK